MAEWDIKRLPTPSVFPAEEHQLKPRYATGQKVIPPTLAWGEYPWLYCQRKALLPGGHKGTQSEKKPS